LEEKMNWRQTLMTAALVAAAALAIFGITAGTPGAHAATLTGMPATDSEPPLMPEIVITAPRPEVVLLPEKVITAPRAEEWESLLMPEVLVTASRTALVVLGPVVVTASRLSPAKFLHDHDVAVSGFGAGRHVGQRVIVRTRTAHAPHELGEDLPVPGVGSHPTVIGCGLCD
jgi:hypothetical protein